MANSRRLAKLLFSSCCVALTVLYAAKTLLVSETLSPERTTTPSETARRSAVNKAAKQAIKGYDSFTVVTWNVWFGEFKMEERYDEILNIFSALSVDVICLQEVTTPFVDKIKEHEFAEQYDISDISLDGSTLGSYGVLTMVRRARNASFHWHELPSEMDRKLLVTTFNTPAGRMSVGNVHLESLNNAPIRAAQLKLCDSILTHTPNSVLCGDFNFDSERNFRGAGPLENDMLQRILPTYKDAWLELHPPSSGKTYDSELNHMLLKKNERMRYDRIMMRSHPDKTHAVVLKNISLLGTHPLGLNPAICGSIQCTLVQENKVQARPVFPSDHFGLHAVFAVPVVLERIP